MINRLSILLAFIGVSVFPHAACADIYAYTDSAGVSHLTNSPDHEGYVLIVKAADASSLSATSGQASSLIGKSKTENTPPQLLAQIEQSAQSNQIQSELIHAVMQVESAYRIRAKSNKGAQGLMQLMPQTAKRFGVKNVYDPAQNIEGGAKYLKQLLTLFNNDIRLTLAAYNAGENAVIKYGYKIPPYKETQAYVPKVLKIYNALRKQRKHLQQEV